MTSASTDWISASSCASVTGSGSEWTATGTETTASDDTRASCGRLASELLANAFTGISPAVPLNATIDGVEVRVEGYSDGAGETWTVGLYSDASGTILSGTATQTLVLPAGGSWLEGYDTAGGSSDLWSAGSITRAALASTDFRVCVQTAGTTSGRFNYVDHVQIKIHYTYTPANESAIVLAWSI